MKLNFKRIVAIILTVLIFGSSLPLTAFASADSSSLNTVAESVSPQEPIVETSQSIPPPVSNPVQETESNPTTSDSLPTESGSTSSPGASTSKPSGGESDSSSSIPAQSASSSQSDSDSTVSSSSSEDSLGSSNSDSMSEEIQPEESESFTPLEIIEMSTTFSGKPGDVVDFFVKLNRDDVQVQYQWQRFYAGKQYDGNGEAIYDYVEGESTRYIFTLDGMTEEEILKINPDATWPGIEMYYDQLKKAGGDTSKVEIAMNTPNYILDSEAAAAMNEGKPLPETAPDAWKDIEGATNSVYTHTVTEEDTDSFYRCCITIVDKAYIAAANEYAQSKNESEQPAKTERMAALLSQADNTASGDVFTDDSTSGESFTDETGGISDESTTALPERSETDLGNEDMAQSFLTDSMHIEMPVQEKTSKQPNGIGRAATLPPALAFGNQFIQNVDYGMEYITELGYAQYGGAAANNPYWTKLNGGVRADNSRYANTPLVEDNKMHILSAWYGKTIYVRRQGNSGQGTLINIPAYTDKNYQTGKTTLYKNSVRALNVYITDTQTSFYADYLKFITDANGYLKNSTNTILPGNPQITISRTSIDSFNKAPSLYLTDAEGTYVFDLVIVGACTNDAPDISGAAAWILKDYINAGYGFLVGHDTLYGYGGVTDPNYVPDKNSNVTPYYIPNTKINGHWNLNWLMGVNKPYTQASPYESPSMILNVGDYTDKSTMYGDGTGKSSLRIAKTMEGSPYSDVAVRCPTNYPYAKSEIGTPFEKNFEIYGTATHTNQQISYGTVWLDYSSNTLQQIGLGKLVTDVSSGLNGTNNFYLSTNGNFGMNQIGHIKDNANSARINEVYIMANTIMYLSQRQQCQVCQSEQGGNKGINFVRRISSLEQLEQLRTSNSWYIYPRNACYMLSENITLPADWEGIENFSSHFNADGKTVTAPAGVSLFKQSGTLGTADGSHWNLGTDSSKGINAISASDGTRRTGVARVLGYLHELFGTANGNAYSGYRVEILGTDGVTYSCLVNADGKYVISNLPCTGIMTARVLDKAGTEVTKYGPIRANVPQGFWRTNETKPLNLIGFKALPVKDTVVYEGQNAIMVNGGAVYQQKVTDITWEVKRTGESTWGTLESAGITYSIAAPVFHELGEDSYTESVLTITAAKEAITGYQFRAVFKNDTGGTVNTYDARTAGNAGLLTVKARPIYLTQAQNKTVFADETVIFTTTSEYWQTFNDGVSVRWQYKVGNADWADVDGSGMFPSFKVNNTTTKNGGTKDTLLAPHLNTSTLTINYVDMGWNDFKFQAVYSYDNGTGSKFWQTFTQDQTGREGRLNVKPSTITASRPQNQKVIANFPVLISPDTVTYKSTATYCPGKVNGSSTPGVPSITWQYKNKLSGVVYENWNQAVATALYPSSGITVNITTGKPIATSNPNEYKVETVMTIKNLPVEMDKGDIHFWFVARAETTHLSKNIIARSENADLSIDYSIDIKHKEHVKTNNADGSSTIIYPNLEVYAPQGLRTTTVQFQNPKHDARNRIVYPTLPSGITASGTQYKVTFQSANLISADVWQNFLRNVQFVVFDETAEFYWRIDENATDLTFSSENGHFYEYVPANEITWTNAYSAARARYNADLDVNGYLATISNAEEQRMVQSVAKGQLAWLGGSNVGTGGAYMYWQDYGGNVPFSYMNWAAGEPSPMTGNEYAAMRSNGQWEISTNTKSKTVTVTDAAPAMRGEWIMIPQRQKSVSIYLQYGHTYYVSSQFGDYGDANTAVTLSCDALGLFSGDAGNPNLSTTLSTMETFYGASGTYEFVFRNGSVGADITGNYGYIYYLDVIDLTAAYGMGEEPSLYFCSQNFVNMVGSISYSLVSTVSDKAGYVVEYGTTGNSFKRTNHSAYDNDIVGGVSTSSDVTVSISAQGKIYDGEEVNAVVNVKRNDGTEISASEKNAVLAALKVSYSPQGTITAANAAGSDCVNAKSYIATVEVKPESAGSIARYNITFNSGGYTVFTIIPRGLVLTSTDNDKVYDGTTSITVLKNKIVMEARNGDTGIISGDTVAIATPSITADFPNIHQTNGKAVSLTRKTSTPLSLTNNPFGNYYIASESYTGKITSRGLELHSLYLETPSSPRNTKRYNGNNKATISRIVLGNAVEGDTIALNATSFAGIYATKNAGETLNPDGTVPDNREAKLTENIITRTEAISLSNNDFGDYFIDSEQYSGAIYRDVLGVRVNGMQFTYGKGMKNPPKYAPSYSNGISGVNTNLIVTALWGEDTLKLDASKSKFTYPEITPTTHTGMYRIDVTGVNEINYPVLSNYVLWYQHGYLSVSPRKVRISMLEGYEKKYGETNPAFDVKYEYATGGTHLDGSDEYLSGIGPGGDTPESAFEGKLTFKTPCTWQSKVQWANDNHTCLPYPVTVSGLTPKVNANGLYNYEIEYVHGGIVVNPVEITITGESCMKTYGNDDPALSYVLSRQRVNPEDLPFEQARRMAGEDVGNYRLIFSHMYDPNYIIKEGPPVYLEITSAQLWVNVLSYQKTYGDDNPEWFAYYAGFKMGDTEQNAMTGHAVVSTVATKKSHVGCYALWPVGMAVRQNKNGLYNYDLIENGGYLTINKRPIDVYADNLTKSVGAPEPKLTYHLGEGQYVVDDTMPLELRLTRVAGETIGTYDIYSDPEEIRLEHSVVCACQRKWDNFNYSLTYHHGKLTIKEPDKLVAVVGGAEKFYGEHNPDASAYPITYILNGKRVNDISTLGLKGTPVVTTSANTKSYVDEYAATITGISSTLYENLTIMPTTLTIKPRPMTIIGNENEKIYGEEDTKFTYKIKDGITGVEYADGTSLVARVNPGDLKGTISRETGEDAHVYLTTLGTLADDPNYALTNIAARYQIFCSWALVGIADNYYKYEGEPNPQFTAYFFNLTGGDTPEEMSEHLIFETDCDENSPPGKYLVTPWYSEFGYKEENYGWNFITTYLYVQERPKS